MFFFNFLFCCRLLANYVTFVVGEILLLILTLCSLAAIFPRVRSPSKHTTVNYCRNIILCRSSMPKQGFFHYTTRNICVSMKIFLISNSTWAIIVGLLYLFIACMDLHMYLCIFNSMIFHLECGWCHCEVSLSGHSHICRADFVLVLIEGI